LLYIGDVRPSKQEVQRRLLEEDLDRMFALLSRYN